MSSKGAITGQVMPLTGRHVSSIFDPRVDGHERLILFRCCRRVSMQGATSSSPGDHQNGPEYARVRRRWAPYERPWF